MGREVKIPVDWNAEVQTNIDRFDFTFHVQKDVAIADRIYGRLFELRDIYLKAHDEDPAAADKEYRLHSELDHLILRAKERIDAWE